MNQQPEDLRSCPFCLGLATLEKIDDRCYGVGCTDCDFQLMNGSVGIGWHESEQEAIAAWNKRGGDLAMSQLRAWVKELQDENTALKAAAQAVEPFGYVNTHTGQFFKDVEPCRKTNEGHWRTVFIAPQAQEDARGAVTEHKPLIARQLGEWHEDDGPVAWWAWCGHEWAGEPAWIGTPLCDTWPGYHTHWTPHPDFPNAARAAQQGGDKQ